MKEMISRNPRINKTLKRNLQAYLFLLPNLILFTACSLYPVVWTLKYVFYQYGGYGDRGAKICRSC